MDFGNSTLMVGSEVLRTSAVCAPVPPVVADVLE